MPPPIPVRTRKKAADGRFGARAVPIEPRPTSETPIRMIGLRPKASENGPTRMAVTAHATAAAVTSCATTGTLVSHSTAMFTRSGPSILRAVRTAKTVKPTAASSIGE